MKITKYFFFALTLLIRTSDATALDITTCDKNFFVVKGEIRSDDLKKIISTCPQAETKMIGIYSEGGDVQEAMKIGRWIRKNKMSVLVSGICYSSCVFLVAGGSSRLLFGEIGIHRPYFLAKPTEGYDAAYKKILNASKSYFREMNVKEQLAEDMFSISPQNIKMLTESEMKDYRLDGKDMAFEEEQIEKESKRFSITREEYIRRKSLFDAYTENCLKFPENFTDQEKNQWADDCFERASRKAKLGPWRAKN